MASKKDRHARAATHNESGVQSAGDAEEQKKELFRVQIGPVGEGGQHINGHHCQDGQHVMMTQEQIDAHRDGGVPLIAVDMENGEAAEAEALDVSEEKVAEDEAA